MLAGVIPHFTGQESTFKEFKAIMDAMVQRCVDVPLVHTGSVVEKFETDALFFLDIDGVCWSESERINPQSRYTKLLLNTDIKEYFLKHEALFRRYYYLNYDIFIRVACWEPGHMQRIRSVCEKFKAGIVVSSNWRVYRTVSQLKNIFDLWGLGSSIISKTRDSSLTACRSLDVEAWLNQHGHFEGRFVIVDDCFGEGFRAKFPHHFIKCDPHKGFDEKVYSSSVVILTEAPIRKAQESNCIIGGIIHLFNMAREFVSYLSADEQAGNKREREIVVEESQRPKKK